MITRRQQLVQRWIYYNGLSREIQKKLKWLDEEINKECVQEMKSVARDVRKTGGIKIVEYIPEKKEARGRRKIIYNGTCGN